MPTSGSVSSSKTASDIINEALREIRVLAKNKEATGTDHAQALSKLNDMLKEWQADGVNLWRESDITITWPAATADGTVDAPEGTRYSDLADLRVVSNGLERPLAVLTRSDYSALPNKAATGTVPLAYNLIRERDSLRLRLWPVPTGITTLKATAVRVIEDVTDGTETLDIPQEWASTVMYNLAARLANPAGRADPNISSVMSEASRLYGLMRAADAPDSIFFERA